MTIVKSPSALLLALLISTALTAPAQADSDAPSSIAPDAVTEPGSTGNGDVLVTARRREERLQDVPVAITALGGEALRAAGVTQLNQLQFLAPNITVAIPNPRNTSIAIRGIGNNPAADGLSASVGVYIDGVYLDRLGMASFDLLDIDRIEVLRGPQGTLFGKNTTAGALSVTTRAPSFTPEIEAIADFGNYNRRHFQLSASAPLSDTVAVRIAGYKDDRDGYIRNINIGGREQGLDRCGLRGQLLFKPDETLSIRLIAEYGRESDSSGVNLLYSPGSSSGPASFLPYNRWVNNLIAAGRIASAPIFDPYGLVTDQNQHQHTVQWQYGLTSIIDKKLGDYTLTSVTGFREWKFSPHSDFDWGPASAIILSATRDHVKSFSQEFRLASPTSGPIEYVLGAYYFHRLLENESITIYGPDYSSGRGAFPGLNNATSTTRSNPTIDSYALFAQGNWHVTPQIDLTGGLRGTYEKAAETISRQALIGSNGGATPQNVRPYPAGYVSTSKFTPSALGTLSWKPSRDLLVYGTISYSAKAGGFNSPSVPQDSAGNFLPLSTLIVKPESATNYELGFKTALWDRRLTINGNLFLANIHDYQANTLVPSQTGFVTLITNVGSVRTKGFELEATARPIKELTFTGSVGYSDAKYIDFRNAPSVQGSTSPTQDLSGRPVAQAPKWNTDIAVDYAAPLTSSIDGYAHADFNYKSGSYGFIDDSDYTWFKAYTVTNFRVGARFNRGAYDLSGWVRNAFDTRYLVNILPAGTGSGGYYASPAEPRTYGVTLRVKL